MDKLRDIGDLIGIIDDLKRDFREREEYYRALLEQKDERIENLLKRVESQFEVIEQLQRKNCKS